MNLYLDFDGVIADTIKVTYKIIRQKGIDLTDKEKVVVIRETRAEEVAK